MPSLRLISNSPNETTTFNLYKTAVELAPGPTIVGATISVNLEAGRRRGVGCADREVACDRDCLDEV